MYLKVNCEIYSVKTYFERKNWECMVVVEVKSISVCDTTFDIDKWSQCVILDKNRPRYLWLICWVW